MAVNSVNSINVKMAAAREVCFNWSALETGTEESPIRLLSDPIPPQLLKVDRNFENYVNLVKTTPKVANSVKTGQQDCGISLNVEKATNSLITADDYCIIRKSGEQWLCGLCKKELSGNREVSDHVMGAEHVASLKKYGCENIAVIQWRVYRCECCNCKIPGKINVCLHLRGKRHAACCSAMHRVKKLETEKTPDQPDQAKLTSDFAKLLRNYRSKTIERMIRRRRGAEQAAHQKVACDFCSFSVNNSAVLHSHLASHLSANFTGAKLDENENLCKPPSPLRVETSSGRSIPDAECTEPPEPINSRWELLPLPLSNKKSFMRVVSERLDSGEDHIYEMRKKKNSTKLSSRLCLVQQDGSVYCLVCRRSAAFDISYCAEHFSSLDHITNLTNMQKDDALFIHAPEELSELRLAQDFMLETPEGSVRCLLCGTEVEDDDATLCSHILTEDHRTRHQAQRCKSTPILRDALQQLCCDWYSVDNYWCVACSAKFNFAVEFSEHLNSYKHSSCLWRMNLSKRSLMFDYCASCALLWYGHSTTCAYHHQLSSHKWLRRDGHYELHDLPRAAQRLLLDVEKYVDENALPVGKSEETIFKSVIEAFPACRRIILFVRQWLLLCNLVGCRGISDCAIFWYVVFYLQQESALPSIATLIAQNSKSRVADDVNIGVSCNSDDNDSVGNIFNLKEHVLRFFRFYGDFDYRHDVACPLLGKIMKKSLFVEPKELPREMSAYVDYTKNILNPEPLRVDFPMCIQDPLNLPENLTKNVSKVYLRRFRYYCVKSRDVLCSI